MAEVSKMRVGSGSLTWWGECRRTLALAGPLIAGQLGQMLMGVADTVMIGRVDVVQLAASTFANTLFSVPFVLGIGLFSAISARTSHARGAHDPDEARRIVRHGTALALAYGVAVVVVLAALLPWLDHFGQPAEVVARTPAFLMLCAVSIVPGMVTVAWKNHADALGHPWVPFGIMLGGVALNVFLNWLWIYGHWGFPAWQLEGAGAATLTSRIATALGLFVWMTRSTAIEPWLPSRWWERFSRKAFQRLLHLGIPASLGLLTEVGAFASTSLVLGFLGTVPLAAHQVTLTCVATAFMVPLGLSMALSVRIGQLAGAGSRGSLRRVLTGAWVCGLAFMACTTVAFIVFGRELAGQFVKDGPVIELAARLLVIGGLFQLADGLQVLSGGALRGVHDVRVPAWFALLAYWGLALPIGSWLALGAGWGAEGMWIGLAIGLASAGVLFATRAWVKLAPEAPLAPTGKTAALSP